jgi:hypothetical protein
LKHDLTRITLASEEDAQQIIEMLNLAARWIQHQGIDQCV